MFGTIFRRGGAPFSSQNRCGWRTFSQTLQTGRPLLHSSSQSWFKYAFFTAAAAGGSASFLLYCSAQWSHAMRVTASTEAEDEMDLLKRTHFSIDDLHQKAVHFREMYPNGLDVNEFAKLLGISDLTHASMIFHAIDTDHNGIIDWKEWLLYASIQSSGTPEEKLDFQFHVYDLNDDGFISFHELVSIVKMQIKTGNIPQAALHHHDHYWQAGKRTPEDLSLELMSKCALSKDLTITRSEFNRLSQEILKLVNFHDMPKVHEPRIRLDRDLQPTKHI